MISRKYTKDYKVEYVENSKGKLRAVATYCGEYYKFDSNDIELKKNKKKFILFSVVTFVTLMSSLCFNSLAAHTIYVSLPHVICLFPMSFQLISAYNLCVLKTPYTREQNDKTVNRQKGSSLIMMIFTTIAFSMQIVNWLINSSSMILPNDIIYTCLMAITTVFACLTFLLRNSFSTVVCSLETY